MTKLKKYSLSGDSIGEVDVNKALTEGKVHPQLMKDYIIAIRHNKRQWSASTKTRSEVKHTTKKATRQKGTGNARHGALVAPQFRGGGIVFGPKPKFQQHRRINKKERQAAIRALLGEKIRKGQLHVIETLSLEAPKTQAVSQFLSKAATGRRVLFLGEGKSTQVETDGKVITASVQQTKHKNFVRSIHNIPYTTFSLAATLNGYDLMVANELFVTEEALQELTQWLCQ